MYRLNCPVKTKTTVVWWHSCWFSLPQQNAVHMWSNGFNRHLNQHMLMYGMCQKTCSETHLKKQKPNWFQLSLCFRPQLPPKTKPKKSPKENYFVHLFLRRSGSHESWRTWTRKFKQIKVKKVKTQQHWAGFNGFWLNGCFVWYLQRRSGGELLAQPAPSATNPTYRFISPNKCLKKWGVCTIYNPRIQNLSAPRYTVLHFWYRRTSDGVEAQRVWRPNPDVSIRHRSF